MATKAELRAASIQYHLLLDQARQAKEQGLLAAAVETAVQAWPYLDQMMQYARKYEDEEFDTVGCVEIVLELAPALLHREAD